MKHEGSCTAGQSALRLRMILSMPVSALLDLPANRSTVDLPLAQPSESRGHGRRLCTGRRHPDVVALRDMWGHHPLEPSRSDVRPDGHQSQTI